MERVKRGKFITFEGCEGVGKSTQLAMLREHLTNCNIDAIYLREPGGVRISEKIRAIILDAENFEMSDKCEVMLYSAARAQLVDEVIRPSLQAGKMIICDRYTDSTTAYQGSGREMGFDFIREINKLVCGDCVPDITIFLDLEPKLAFQRKGGADKGDRLEQQQLEFHQKVYAGYKEIEKLDSKRFFAVPAIGSKEEIHREVVGLLVRKGII